MALGTPKGQSTARPQAKQGGVFQPCGQDYKPRIIMNVQALEKRGKNHFAFTAPGPIGVLSMDRNLDGVVQRFIRQGKKIDAAKFKLNVQPGDASDKQVAEAAEVVWDQYCSAFRDALRAYRTVVADTWTEVYELVRLARFGKLTQVMPHHYGPVNAEMRDLHREADEHDCNLILLHKMKDEYINKVNKQGKEVGEKTGKIVLAGWKDVVYQVQMNVQAWREDGGGQFHIGCLDCGVNGDVAGRDWVQGADGGFAEVMMEVYPEVDPGVWL